MLIREESREEKVYDIAFGFCAVRLPDIRVEDTEGRSAELYMVVVTGFGEKPMMLLTNLPIRKNRSVLSRIIQSYHTRWRIEETIRFIKQSYRIEDVRVLTYGRLQNMMSLVLAVSYFTMTHLGQRLKLRAMSSLLLEVSRRIFGIPDFRFYALADGIRELLKRSDKGPLRYLPNKPRQPQFSLFSP